MRAAAQLLLGILGLVVITSGAADAATISGTVAGPDGAAFRGAFVQARNAKSKIVVSVLSDRDGKYRIENLPAGEYRLQIKAPGYKSDPKSGVNLTAEQAAAHDFKLQNGMVRWSDISMCQGMKLLPEARGRDLFFVHCMACHGFQSRMAAVTRNEDGWRDRMNYMRDAMGFFVMDPRFGFNDQKAEDVIFYMNHVFGEDSVLPKSPAELPNYKDTVRQFPDEALKIVYVEYETPGPDRMPWSAHPDKDGSFWVPYYGRANKIARLNPATGEMKEFPVPNLGTAAIHSAVPAPDGSVWLTEQGSDKLGRWDPQTREDHRVSGRRAQAHRQDRSQDRPRVVDRRAHAFRSEDRKIHPHPRRADLLRHRPRCRRQCLVHRAAPDRQDRQGRCQDPAGDQVHDPDRQRPAAPHRGRCRRHRLVRAVRRRQDRPLRSEDRDLQGVSAARTEGDAVRARHR